MKTKALSGVLCCLIVFLMSVCTAPIKAQCKEYTVDEVQSLINGIASYKMNSAGAGSVQDWINGSLTDGAGSLSEWYIIALSQDGQYDFSSYEKAMRKYIENVNEVSATTCQKYALALIASGSGSSYIPDVLDGTVGEQGIMSLIYGLHILNNDYTFSRRTRDDVMSELVSLQCSDGGWALYGDYGDIDVTAMTIQALAPHYRYHQEVYDAVNKSLNFLSERQKDNGGYQSFGTPNPESACQVLTALSAIGIDCQNDDRFIKNGNTVIDGITAYRLPDGSFRHTMDGDSNETATIQAFYSLIAYKRMLNGRGSLYLFDNRQETEEPTEPPHTETTPARTSAQFSTAVSTMTSSGNTELSTTVSTEVSKSGTSSKKVSSTKKTTSAVTVTSVQTTDTSAVISMHIDTETSSITTVPPAEISADTGSSGSSGNYKIPAAIAVVAIGASIAVVFFVLDKRSPKNFIAIAVLTAAGVCAVLFIDIQSKEEYYQPVEKDKNSIVGTVTMEIRCDTIVGKSDSKYIPDDGIILDVTSFDIQDGETVFDVLTEAAKTYSIQIDNKGSSGGAHGLVYIAGINYLYEFDFGDLSGWVYHVNGLTPSKGCGEYVVHDGDQIQWLYTCELGHDLNEVYEE